MKRLLEVVIAILVILAFGFVVIIVYRAESSKRNIELERRIREISPRRGPPETIEALRQAIALYETQIERNVREGAQTGVYWKILAVRLSDRGMYNDALEALERAIYFNTEDPVLYYLIGISAANVAKSKVGFTANIEVEKNKYFGIAENSYLRALELDATYAKAMYGLAILYVFELDRPQEAIVHLERYIQLQSSDIAAMFVLARTYFMLENYQQAVEIYDRIASRTRNQREKEEALNNREIIQRLRYE